jgi:hypothetical protein
MTREVGVYDDPQAPTLLSKDGIPFEGETLVEFVSAGAPIHFFDERKAAQRSSRIVAWFRAIEFDRQQLPRYYPVICTCDKPHMNTECKQWRPKKGARSNLGGDAAIALGRLPKNGESLKPSSLFRNKLFKADVAVVRSDRSGKPLPPPRWHSKLGSLTKLEAGGLSTSSHPVSHPDSCSDSDAFPLTKTIPVTTTKDGIEDVY